MCTPSVFLFLHEHAFKENVFKFVQLAADSTFINIKPDEL